MEIIRDLVASNICAVIIVWHFGLETKMSHACCHYQGSDHILVTDVTSIPGARSKQPKNCKNLKKNVFRIKAVLNLKITKIKTTLIKLKNKARLLLPTSRWSIMISSRRAKASTFQYLSDAHKKVFEQEFGSQGKCTNQSVSNPLYRVKYKSRQHLRKIITWANRDSS